MAFLQAGPQVMACVCRLGLQEISMLKTCRSPNITQYYGSSVIPGTTQLMIIMELMAVSVSDMVGVPDKHSFT